MYQFELAVVGTVTQITSFADWTIAESPILNLFSNTLVVIDSRNRKYLQRYRGSLSSDRLESWDGLIDKAIKVAQKEFGLDCAYVKIGKTLKDVKQVEGKNLRLSVKPAISSLVTYRGVDKEV